MPQKKRSLICGCRAREKNQRECYCRAFDIGLDNLLGKAVNRPSKDLILGMDCLLHAFAPELAGKTIKQVGDAGEMCFTHEISCHIDLKFASCRCQSGWDNAAAKPPKSQAGL